jgi:hypothetical protein
MRKSRSDRPTLVHPYAWLWEPLQQDASFVLRSMFGTRAAYIAGRLTLCFSARAEPWHGVLVATDQSHHASLRAEFAALVPHPILPKWLFLPDSSPSFESTAERLVKLVRQHDVRIGIEPKPRTRVTRRAPKRAQKTTSRSGPKKTRKTAKKSSRRVS